MIQRSQESFVSHILLQDDKLPHPKYLLEINNGCNKASMPNINTMTKPNIPILLCLNKLKFLLRDSNLNFLNSDFSFVLSIIILVI